MPQPPEAEKRRSCEEEPTEAYSNSPDVGSSPGAAPGSGRFAPGSIMANRFRIVSPLGRGGMGEVYRAEDLRLGETVALKFLPEQLASHPGALERMRDEVRVGRQIAHPNVCRIYDLMEAHGQCIVAMEYVDGEDLASLLLRIGRLPADKAVELAYQICAGLAAIHDQDILHRDLKPGNIMVDGRGRARITDFGLAAPTREIALGEFAGTPAYMAPELLSGGKASAKTDLYALGVVLYEMFSGKRPFVAKNTKELVARQRGAPPPNPDCSSPSLDQIVLRCLDPDPEKRPSSARTVLAAIPGGDPLERAIAKGETPSPEMVAAAEVVGDLKPAAAWALLLGAIAGLVAVAWISDTTSNLKRIGFPKPPAALIADARRVLATVEGHVAEPVDYACEFSPSSEQRVMKEKYGSEAADRLHPGPIRFWYRQRPAPLVPRAGKFRLFLFLPGLSDLGPVSRDDPALTFPGEAEVVLDPAGRLIELTVVAPEVAEPVQPAAAVSQTWNELLARAGFKPASLTPTQPLWTPPVASDTRLAWRGERSDQAGVPLRIEAAAFAGHPVWLRVLGRWVEAQQAPRKRRWDKRLSEALMVALLILGLPFWLALVRRNLLLGRGDRRGALRLAFFVFLALTMAGIFRVNHLSDAMAETDLLMTLAAQSAFVAFVGWLAYLAIEPFVRRRWPRTLIAWTRVLAGRFGDPIVGRDVLVGLFVGVLVVLAVHADHLLREGTGWSAWSTALSSARYVAYCVLLNLAAAPVRGLASLLLWVVLCSLLRSEGRAVLAGMLLCVPLLFAFMGVGPMPVLVLGLLMLVVRFGLLASSFTFFVFILFLMLPMTLQPSVWYAGQSLAVLIVFAAVAVFAFSTSLGGKPLFGADIFEA